MANNVQPTIEQSQDLTIQSEITEEANIFGGRVFPIRVMAAGGSIIAPWWSQSRDQQLRDFWKLVDHLSGAIYTLQSKMTAIPNKVIAKDTSIKAHVEQAAVLTDILHGASQFGDGWVEFYGQFVEDLLTQDNGAFAEVIGRGSPIGPIVGPAMSVAHLDSARCTRTGNATYPVVYTDVDGTMYKLHRSRVMMASQMKSPRKEMFGVGFCAVSRAINISQNLLDIVTYKQEKLGSRPLREFLITKGGLDPSDLHYAIALSEQKMDDLGFSRYSKVIIGGSSTLPEASVERHELSGLPEGFDEQTSIIFGMATIALALGVDARELFPAMSSGATRADAMLQHLKQRGKGPGQIIQTTEQLFNYKFLPDYLHFVFDFQDDAEDRQRAEIRQIRANARVQDLATGAISERMIREKMVEDGDLDQSKFERMEMEDGRLPDGTPILSLFYADRSNDVSKYLDVGVADPLDLEGNDPQRVLDAIQDQRRETMSVLANSGSRPTRQVALQAYYALQQLEMRYRNPEIYLTLGDMPNKPEPNYIDPRTRRVDVKTPNANEPNSVQDSLRAGPADRQE